jgi:hypothetical protein
LIVHLGERIDVSERVDLGAPLDLPAVEDELMQVARVAVATVELISKVRKATSTTSGWWSASPTDSAPSLVAPSSH